MSSKIYHIQSLNLLAYKLNSCNEDEEHLIETVYYIHLKSNVCNLNLTEMMFIHYKYLSCSGGDVHFIE